ncbi:MAG TPA: response regulator [Bacteroidia bacterium]|nr:response regulator [Bacteroidia bacterium]HNS11213.1 response regulator [Bacteroidia bacterium]
MNNNLKVLLVDDEPDVVEILSYNLKKEKYQVFKAYNGLDCIKSALENHPDLIIMDIRMPEMTGIETCRKIRQNEMLKDIPVLFLTADSDEYTSMNAMDAGGSHFITKPIRPAILIGMIKELIN